MKSKVMQLHKTSEEEEEVNAILWIQRDFKFNANAVRHLILDNIPINIPIHLQ
jgi:hypothetical protein